MTGHPRRNSFAGVLTVALTGALAITGCGPPPPPPPLVESGALGMIQDALDARAEGLATIHAGLEVTWEDPRFEEPEHCRASLSFAAPDSLRLRGVGAAFFTVFDLVAAGQEVWLDVPREGFTVFGGRQDPSWDDLPLSPRALLIALLAHPCPGGECLDEVRAATEGGMRILSGGFGALECDLATGLPVRLAGRAEQALRISWSDWFDRDGVAWPRSVEIERSSGERLSVSWGRVRIGRPVPASRFRPEQDVSREILTPADAVRRWRGQ